LQLIVGQETQQDNLKAPPGLFQFLLSTSGMANPLCRKTAFRTSEAASPSGLRKN
jgi:hypothetical protein